MALSQTEPIRVVDAALLTNPAEGAMLGFMGAASTLKR